MIDLKTILTFSESSRLYRFNNKTVKQVIDEDFEAAKWLWKNNWSQRSGDGIGEILDYIKEKMGLGFRHNSVKYSGRRY
jgi:hypothetical protein